MTSAYGQCASSPESYFQDDAAFKGKRRELVAEDYVYAYKRYFDPRWKSPALASLSELKIVGMAAVREAAVKGKQAFNYDTTVEGLRALDRYTVRFAFEEPQPRFHPNHGHLRFVGRHGARGR